MLSQIKTQQIRIKKEINSLTESKEDKLLDAITRNLLEMELILLEDEELILIEKKTKQEEKGFSLTKTKNNKRGTPSVKRAMKERSQKNKPQDSKSKAQTTFQETRKQRRNLSQKQKEPQLARSIKVDRQTTNTKIQTTMPRRENASETKDPRSKLLSL